MSTAVKEPDVNGSTHKPVNRIGGAIQKTNGTTKLGTIETRWEFITPEIAKRYLKMNVQNRRQIAQMIERYATDMHNERWVITHQGIAFDEDSRLVDGQHRLEAIVQSGAGQYVLVTRNLPPESVAEIDTMKARSIANALQIMGYAHSDGKIVSIARRMMIQWNQHFQRTITNSMVRDFIDRHLDAIVFAKSIPTRHPVPILALVARAFYTVEPAKLEEFCDILKSGEGNFPGCRPVRLLRDLMMRGEHHKGSTAQASTYSKALNALSLFLASEDVKQLRGSNENRFPLPEETQEVETNG